MYRQSLISRTYISLPASEDYFALISVSVTFSGQSTELPTLRLSLSEDSIAERTEQLHIHLRLPPKQQGVVLENASAIVVILDNDGIYIYNIL